MQECNRCGEPDVHFCPCNVCARCGIVAIDIDDIWCDECWGVVWNESDE
jgi:hypothetical protein